MHLRESEQILKVFRHHPTPFAKNLLIIIFASLPFFMLVFFVSQSLKTSTVIWVNVIVISLFIIVILHAALIFWLDRLVVTSQRVIYVNWATLFNRDEYEAELTDIQEISTKEKGIFSALYFFDYGVFRLETASTKTTILFDDAPDPEGIKHFIYAVKNPPHHEPPSP